MVRNADDMHFGCFMVCGSFCLVFKMQNCVGGVNQDCVKDYTAKGEDWRCFFPQYTEPYIKSKLFALNSQYDTWQLGNILQLPCNPPKCTAEQMKLLENFGKVNH